MLKYRADIDGLRAFAVLPVVLFHAGTPFMKGGYIGVDIFFTISGFLITSILLREFENGSFSLTRFYERRARRIIPALMFVGLVTALLGGVVLLPAALVDLAESFVATALFVSNVYFWTSLDYFAPNAELSPMLHTWSLAVEEQFYIFFPLILWAIIRFNARRHLFLIILGMTIISFLVAAVVVFKDSSLAFYQTPLRAWELGVGALLATAPQMRDIPKHLAEGTAALGLLSITLPVFFYTADTRFPGIAALPPVLGAGALIWAGSYRQTAVSRLLAWSPLVWVGLISYSLYLWHWPLMALMRANNASIHLSSWEAFTCVLASFGLAWVSYQYVEKPFRSRARRLSPSRTLLVSGASLASFILLGAMLIETRGFPSRFSKPVLFAAAGANDKNPYGHDCMRRQVSAGLCIFGNRTITQPEQIHNAEYLLWGDSHADALMPAVAKAAAEADVSVAIATHSACPPIPRLLRQEWARGGSCERFNEDILNHLLNTDHFPTVVLAARWALSVEGKRYGDEAGSDVILKWVDPLIPATPKTEGNVAQLTQSLDQTLAAIRATGRNVILIGPVPEIGWDVPNRMARALRRNESLPKVPTPAEVEARTETAVQLLKDLAAKHDAIYVDLIAPICASGCRVDINGRPTYWDDDHLSVTGAQNFAYPEISPLFNSYGTDQPSGSATSASN